MIRSKKQSAENFVNNFLRKRVDFTSLPKIINLLYPPTRGEKPGYGDILNNRWLFWYITKRSLVFLFVLLAGTWAAQPFLADMSRNFLQSAVFVTGFMMIAWFSFILLAYTVAKSFFQKRAITQFIAQAQFLQRIQNFDHILSVYLFAVLVRFEGKKVITDIDISRLLKFGKNLAEAPETLLEKDYRGVTKELWSVLARAHQGKNFSDIVFMEQLHNQPTEQPLVKDFGSFLKAWKQHEGIIFDLGYGKDYQSFLDDIKKYLEKNKIQKTFPELV